MRTKTLKLVAVALLAALATALTLTAASGARHKRHGAPHNTLTANLRGSEEVPGPGDPDGRGKALVKLLPRFGAVCFRLEWSNIADPTRAHIHRGARGTADDIVVGFFEADNVRQRGCTEGVDENLIREIRRNPRGFYVNIHNGEFPGGAIRGQLKRTGHRRGHGRGRRR
jgi:CHRD domain-containing protein